MDYKHGAYGELTNSKVSDAQQADVVAAYIGTAPVNLIRGYADANVVNMPIKVANMSDAQAKLGYADDWKAFTLCEAFAQHFDNIVGNIGPIYVVNVLDPATHKKAEKTTTELTFSNNRAEFESSTIILDTFAIADKVEGVDYALEYNFAKGTVVVRMLKDEAAEAVQCSYDTVDTTAVTDADIIGQTTDDGQYTGLHAMKLLYQYHNAVLNMLAAPGWSQIPAVYKAMVSTVQKLNGHWDGFVNADIPLEDTEGNKIDTIANLHHNSLTDPSMDVCKEKPADELPNTFVAGRNLIFLTYAAVYAYTIGAHHLVTGVSEADYSGYPDCRNTFIKAANAAVALALDYDIEIHTPLMWRDKAAVWQLSDELGVLDLVRNKTLTCYNGIPADGCGECPACRLRRAGLEKYLSTKK